MPVVAHTRVALAGLLCLLLHVSAPPQVQAADARANLHEAPHVDEQLLAQRELYRQAQRALAAGRSSEFRGLLEQLDGYPLLPYLEYAELSPRLVRLPSADVERFLDTHAGSWLGNRLESAWAAQLARQRRWDELLRYPEAGRSSTVLRCQILRARLEAGDSSALSEVAPLWNVARSQPNECDPVFEVWMAENLLTADLAWDRFGKTLRAGQHGLARYISRLMPSEQQQLAELFLRIDRQPEQLRTIESIPGPAAQAQEIVEHGVRQLARIDAQQAMVMLNTHKDRVEFAEADVVTLQQFIAQRLLLQGFVEETESLVRMTPELASETIVSWLLRDALAQQDWQRVAALLERLPQEARQSERWMYWHARMLEQRGDSESLAEARSLYRQVAATRSFYGFLAADWLDTDYELFERPVAVSHEQMLALYNVPAILRAYELLQLDEEPAARNEWQQALSSFTESEVMAAGKLAESWGWHRNSVQAMIRIGYWDDLQLRFPLAYTEQFASAAEDNRISAQLLMAVARQESALMPDVRSPAGARGLMQLMPATARQTAGRVGIRISDQDLYTPDINIVLGSRYLAEMLEDFGGNRALAAAAYNAGPNRVRQWLRNTGENPVPLDIWIEIIPFAETRGYVQNVLAYSLIYAHRMGERRPFLTAEEAASQF